MTYFQHSNELPAWIGTPPDGWRTDWLKWHVRLSTERPSVEEAERLPYIANEDLSSWTGKLLKQDLQPTSADSRKFYQDDVLFNKLRPYLAKVYHATFAGVSSGELLCLRPSERVLPRYMFYVVGSKAFVDAVNAETFGSKMPRADWDIVGHQPLPLPRREVQRRIVDFLDEKTAQIDGLIEKKRKLIDQLAEKRQAIITRVVTKGLDLSAPIKDSGIDWLGEIPAHWELRRLSSFCFFQSGKAHEPFIDPDGEYVCVNARFISTNGVTEKRCAENLCPAAPGDILMVMSDLPNGRALARTFLTDDRASYAVNQRVCRIRLQRGNPSYFSYQLNRHPQLLRYDDGNEQTHLPNAAFKQMLLLVPTIGEQNQIVEYLDEILDQFDRANRRVERSINLLQEYRFSLVTAAVTGQIQELR